MSTPLGDLFAALDRMNESGQISYEAYSELHDIASFIDEREN